MMANQYIYSYWWNEETDVIIDLEYLHKIEETIRQNMGLGWSQTGYKKDDGTLEYYIRCHIMTNNYFEVFRTTDESQYRLAARQLECFTRWLKKEVYPAYSYNGYLR